MIKNPKRVDSVEMVVVVVVMVWQVLRFLHLRNGCPPYISREIQRIIAIILVKSLHHIKTHDSNLLDASSDDPHPALYVEVEPAFIILSSNVCAFIRCGIAPGTRYAIE